MTPRTITITHEWAITDGPSREELFDALRLFNERRRVEFELQEPDFYGRPGVKGNKHRLKMQINSISVEDGSGHNWTLTVYIFGVDNQLELTNTGPYELYYHDRGQRHGTILSTPAEEKVTVKRGEVWWKGRKIGDIPHTSHAI